MLGGVCCPLLVIVTCCGPFTLDLRAAAGVTGGYGMTGVLGALGDWPGKRDDQDRRHPAVWHMLDVAATAEILVASGPLRRFPQGWQRAIVFLIALHDCGKISQAFRNQIETRRPPPEDCRHWQLSLHMRLRLDEVLGGVVARKCHAKAKADAKLFPARAGMNRRWHAPKPFEPNLVLGLYSQFMLPFSIVGRLESGSVG